MKTKQTKTQRINAMVAKYPDMKPREIAKRLGVGIGLVYQVRYETKKNSEFVNKVFTKAKKKPSKIIKAVSKMKDTLDALDKIKDKPLKRDLKAEAWAKKNPWWGVDEDKTAQALGYHKELIDSGVDPKSDEYWEKIDAKFNPDLVNHPAHYKAGGIETINFIEAKDLNYRLGNVVKYVSRAGKKDSDPVQDLEKAAWYLNREIEARKRA